MSEGYSSGDICFRDNCTGVIEEYEKEGCCSCHINPPCGFCVEPNAYCPKCGWDAKEEQDFIDKIQYDDYIRNEEYYGKKYQDRLDSYNTFYKKYNGELPIDKLEIRSESHTHFTMKVIGVFPKGTETYESLIPKIRGTFGGRFTSFIDENSYRFSYIAYTD